MRQDFDQIVAKSDALINSDGASANHFPCNTLYRWAEAQLSLAGQEALVSFMMVPYGTLIDDLAATMSADETMPYRIDGRRSVGSALEMLLTQYDWTAGIDFDDYAQQARVWRVSEEKLEPRLGERLEELLEPYEQPLRPGLETARMHRDLAAFDQTSSLGEFLLRHPQHRHIARRLQLVDAYEHAEIRDNTIAAEMVPTDLLRCKLSFFGATKFDPRSDRWLRITMYQGAPYPHELADCDPDDMVYPALSADCASG